MLKIMRTSKLFTIVILSAVTVMIIIVFIFWGIGPMDNPTTTAVAEIEKEKITLDEFWRTYDNEIKRAKDSGTSDEDLEKLNLKDRVLELLVDRKVISVAAGKAGITVSEKELQKEIINTPYFQRDGVFDKAVYSRALSMNRLSPQIYETMLKNDMINNKLIRLIGETTELSPDEVKILDSLSGGNKEQLIKIFRSNKSSVSVKAYVEGFKKQLNIKINRDLIA